MGKAVFYIKNYAYNEDKRYLHAGDRYNRDVYVNSKELNNKVRPSAKWIFEAVLEKDGTETGYFHIKDISHSKYILTEEKSNGKICHDVLKGEANEQWKFEFVRMKGWVITDRKHKKSLVGGHSYNGQVYHQDAKNGTQIKEEAIWEVAYCEGGGVNDFPLFLLKEYGKATKCKIERIKHNDTEQKKEVYSMEIELDPKVDINKSDEDYTIKTTQEEKYTLTSSTKITDEFAQKVIDLVSDMKTDSQVREFPPESVFSSEGSTVKTTTSTKKVTKEYVWTYQEKEEKERKKYHVKFTCYTHIMKYKVTTTVEYNDGNRKLDGEFTSEVVVEKGNNWEKG